MPEDGRICQKATRPESIDNNKPAAIETATRSGKMQKKKGWRVVGCGSKYSGPRTETEAGSEEMRMDEGRTEAVGRIHCAIPADFHSNMIWE